MADTGGSTDAPVAQKIHQLDQYVLKGVNKADSIQGKLGNKEKSTGENKNSPAGGFDDTSIPRAPAGYTVKFTFHRASSLPFADVNTLSSDPYILAELNTEIRPRHKQDPPLRHRTPTIRRNVNPEWNNQWIVANVPASGFRLKCRLYDEDPSNHDDRLGNVHVNVSNLGSGFQPIREQAYKIKKASGSKRAYLVRGCAAMFNRNIPLSGSVFISVDVLGRTETDHGGQVYTLGPCQWIKHYSPVIGRLAGTKDTEDQDGHQVEKYNFQANQIQLQGPVPAKMYHRYVEFKPFVKGMFTGLGLRGKVLNRALHHQHARIYNFDRSTEYGSFEEPCTDMTKQFLDLVHYDEGGRIFTYVLSLDGLWRFTETGKEFGIDLLSKHTMHSDVSIYIAFSGEFFIRRLKNPKSNVDETQTHPPDDIDGGPPQDSPPKDPAYYQLIIDNDSGTYRPNKDLLPLLKGFMSQSLPGLKVTTLDCQGDEEKMNKLKNEQRERKKAEGQHVVYQQLSDDSSISSSDESDLDEAVARENGEPKPGHREKMHQKYNEKQEKARNIAHGESGSAKNGEDEEHSEKQAQSQPKTGEQDKQPEEHAHAGHGNLETGPIMDEKTHSSIPATDGAATSTSGWGHETAERMMEGSGASEAKFDKSALFA